MKRHFVFADGTVVTKEYAKGDQKALETLSDKKIQDEYFPSGKPMQEEAMRFGRKAIVKWFEYDNYLERVFETEC